MTLAALILLTVGGGCFFARVIVGPSLADRIVALDGLIVTSVAAIVLNAVITGGALFLDAALVVAFVGFVGTSAAARYVERRGG